MNINCSITGLHSNTHILFGSILKQQRNMWRINTFLKYIVNSVQSKLNTQPNVKGRAVVGRFRGSKCNFSDGKVNCEPSQSLYRILVAHTVSKIVKLWQFYFFFFLLQIFPLNEPKLLGQYVNFQNLTKGLCQNVRLSCSCLHI